MQKVQPSKRLEKAKKGEGRKELKRRAITSVKLRSFGGGRAEERTPSIRGVKKKKKNSQRKLSLRLFVCVVGAGETKRTESEGEREVEEGGGLTRSTTHLRDARPREHPFFFFFCTSAAQRDVTSSRGGKRFRAPRLFSFRVDGECGTQGLNILPGGSSTCSEPSCPREGPLV